MRALFRRHRSHCSTVLTRALLATAPSYLFQMVGRTRFIFASEPCEKKQAATIPCDLAVPRSARLDTSSHPSGRLIANRIRLVAIGIVERVLTMPWRSGCRPVASE